MLLPSPLSLVLACITLSASVAAQAVTPAFPLSLKQDGAYVYTDNTPGCVKGAGPSVNATWTALQGFEMCAVGWSVGQPNRCVDWAFEFGSST